MAGDSLFIMIGRLMVAQNMPSDVTLVNVNTESLLKAFPRLRDPLLWG